MRRQCGCEWISQAFRTLINLVGGDDETWVYTQMYTRLGLLKCVLLSLIMHPVANVYNVYYALLACVLYRLVYQWIYSREMRRCKGVPRPEFEMYILFALLDVLSMVIVICFRHPALIPLIVARWLYQPGENHRFIGWRAFKYAYSEIALFPLSLFIVCTFIQSCSLYVEWTLIVTYWLLGRYLYYRYRSEQLLFDLLVQIELLSNDPNSPIPPYMLWNTNCPDNIAAYETKLILRRYRLVDPLFIYPYMHILYQSASILKHVYDNDNFRPGQYNGFSTCMTLANDGGSLNTKRPNLLWQTLLCQSSSTMIQRHIDEALLSSSSPSSSLALHFVHSPLFDKQLVPQLFEYCGWTPVTTTPSNGIRKTVLAAEGPVDMLLRHHPDMTTLSDRHNHYVLSAHGTLESWLRQPIFRVQPNVDLDYIRSHVHYKVASQIHW